MLMSAAKLILGVQQISSMGRRKWPVRGLQEDPHEATLIGDNLNRIGRDKILTTTFRRKLPEKRWKIRET